MRVDKVQVFLSTRRWYLGGLRLLRALFDGFWLGALRDRDLAEVNRRYYDSQPSYVDDDYTRSGLLGWEADAVRRHFDGCRRVVVTSAGGGREVLALLNQGTDAVGYEPQRGLVAYGRDLLAREGHPDRLHPSPHDEWPASPGCDGAIVGWGAYMLIPGRARRVAYLRAARADLPDGAPLLVSFFVRTQSGAQLRLSHRVASLIRRVTGREPVEYGDVLEPNRLHCFTRREIADELADAGFELVDYGQNDYGWAVGRALG